MDAYVIKEFLVSLGFKVDEKGQQSFTDGIKKATETVMKMGVAIEGAALAITGFTAKIADQMEVLYFASQRTGASVQNIQAFSFAAGQMGSTAAAAQGSLENFARFMRTNPGSEGFLHSIGVQTREANGAVRDTADVLADVGQQLAGKPYYLAKRYADTLGIDENTLRALMQGMDQFSTEYKRMAQAAGVDSKSGAASSHEFMNQLRLLLAAVQLLVTKVATSLTGSLAANIKRFRESLVDNFDKISGIISKTIKVVLVLADIVGTMVMRATQAVGDLIEWWTRLDHSSKTLIETFGLILAAWKVLNAGFLTSPIGMVLGLAAALVLLYDDYKGWKEGKQSLIDWSKWAPEIEKGIAGIKALIHWLGLLIEKMGGLKTVAEIVAGVFAFKFAVGVGSSLLSILGVVGKVTQGILSMAPAVASVAMKIGKVFSAIPGAASAALVAASAAIGYAIGTWINDKFINGTKFGENIGHGVTAILAALGVTQAKEALANNAKQTPGATTLADVNAARAKMGKAPITEAQYHKSTGSSAVISPTSVQSTPTNAQHPTAHETRGIRNNNPGNINYVGQAGAAKEAGDSGRFAVFQTAQEGLNALAAQLRRYGERGINSIQSVIAKWAPPGENNTQAYIASVAKSLGVAADAKLDIGDPKILESLMNAIIRVENGKNPYTQNMLAQAAGDVNNVSNGAPTLQQTTHITVNGSSDPAKAARQVSIAQDSANARALRNLQGAAA